MGWTFISFDRARRNFFIVFVVGSSVKAVNKREDNIKMGCRGSGSVIVVWTRC